MSSQSIVKKDQSKEIVFDYNPQEFPVRVSPQADDFVSQQEYKKTDFKISDLVAQQAGITELQRKTHEDKIEALALERLRAVEEKAYKEAYELGLIEGTEKAFAESNEEFVKRLKTLDEVLDRVERLKRLLVVENEGSLVKLVYHIARKVAMKEIEEHPEVIKQIISQLVESIQTDEKVTVRLSQTDFDFIEKLRGQIRRESDPLTRVKCEPSEGIAPGGCIVDTNYGSIDATIEERVSKAWDILEKRVPRPRDENNG